MTDGFPLGLPTALETARRLVRERFPGARCAWLAGSVVAGRASVTSDLDIVVLLTGPPAPFRESLVVSSAAHRVPVELFVHTCDSVRLYVAKDRDRRQPTMARLVSEGVPLADVPTEAADLVQECADDLARGPDPLTPQQIDAQRYAVTDLREDLRGARSSAERAVLAATVWDAAARLLLGFDRRWAGTGKGLLRALDDRDTWAGDPLGQALTDGLVAVGPDAGHLIDAVGLVLDRAGGELFEGYRLGGASRRGTGDR